MDAKLRQWVATVTQAPLRRETPLLVEASHRRFHRIWLGEASFVVMDSPPARERNADFVARQRLFSGAGAPVPKIIAMDAQAGFFLLSDLGDRRLEDAYQGPDRGRALALAITHLVRIQDIKADDVPPYEEGRFRDELNIFVEWFLGRLLNQVPDAAMAPAFDRLLDNVLGQPQSLIHRDYHCRNLLLDQQGRFGIVDFQDALVGPATYDLACLLWDCYHRFDDAERRHWQGHYQAQARFDFDALTLSRMLDLTGLQRQFKALGIFVRLWLRDGKATHLRYIGPVLQDMQHIAGLHLPTLGLKPWLGQLAASAAEAIKAAA